MRASALAGVLLGSLLAVPAAATPARDSMSRLAAALRSSAPDSPLLSGRLDALRGGLKSLVEEKSIPAAAAKPVADEAAALRAELDRGERAAADEVRKLADDAQGLLLPAAAPVPCGRVPDFRAGFPPPESAALSALQTHAAAMAAVMERTGFDGGPSAAAAPAPVPAAPPRPRDAARRAEPVDGARVAFDQGALNPFLKSQRRRALAADGRAGAGTGKAVAFFQRKKGLPETGVIDRDTEASLLADFQARRRLPVTGALDEATAKALRGGRSAAASAAPVYYRGSESDFEPKAGARTIKDVLATVYTPYLAKAKKPRRMEGPPIDRHDQAVCTLERYLGGVCPYVSVAVDPRLGVPNGTPLLIPEISALAGRTVRFRIVDTGSTKRFKGTGHIDVAADSSQRSGFGRLISGGRVTLVLPEGLHPSGL